MSSEDIRQILLKISNDIRDLVESETIRPVENNFLPKEWQIKNVVTPMRWCDLTTDRDKEKIEFTIQDQHGKKFKFRVNEFNKIF